MPTTLRPDGHRADGDDRVDDPLPTPEESLESAAYSGTEQTAIGQEDSDPPPGIVTKTFAYSAANRMAGVSLEGELIMSYRYNGAGERVYRSGSNETVHTVFDQAGHWIGDYDATGTAIQQAIWFEGMPVGLVRNAGNALDPHYVEADALGTPRAVIDPTRDVAVWRWDLDNEAFGESEPDNDPDGDGIWFVLEMRYPGQQYDSATGFNYNYFRDYDPSVGRYLQSDPIGLGGGISTYGYVGGNPLIGADPMGLAQPALRPPLVAPRTPQLPPVANDPFYGPRGPIANQTPRSLLWVLEACVANPVACAVAGSLLPRDIAAPACEMPGGPACTKADHMKSPEPLSREIWIPDRRSGKWTCKARADCNDNIPGNCPEDPAKRFAFGGGVANNLGTARNIAKSNATHNLQCQPKHVSCKCTGPTGQPYSGGC